MMIGQKMKEKIYCPVRFSGQGIGTLMCNTITLTIVLTFDQRYFRLGTIFFMGLKVSDSHHSSPSETIKKSISTPLPP